MARKKAVITLTLGLTADTGTSSSDKITANPAIKGTGQAGTLVTIKKGSTTLGTAMADSTGAWSFTPVGLADGVHTLTASQTDIAGNTGSASLTFTLDRTAPNLTLGLTADTGTSSSDKITANPAIKGTGQAGTLVTIKKGSTTLGTAMADSTGAWSFTPVGLADGVHTLTASQTDIAGNTGSASLTFTLDRTAPNLTLGLTADTGTSSSDKITANPAIKGTGQAGTLVTIKKGSTTLGTAMADSTGAWSFTPVGLADGVHTLTASQTDIAGNTGSASLTFTLDRTAQSSVFPDKFGPVQNEMPPGAIVLRVGDDYQSVIDLAPNGATLWFEAGTHRLSAPLIPKSNQTITGDARAVLKGSRLITQFAYSNSYYAISGQPQQGFRNPEAVEQAGFDRAGYPETVFIDGQPLKPEDKLSELEAGEFYFDYDSDVIYIADNPAGRVVEVGFSPAAFIGTAQNVTISNLTITQFNSPVQHGAIQALGTGWSITYNEVYANYGVGVIVTGNGSKVEGNKIHNNGQMGLGGTGSDLLIQGNEIAKNGFWSGIDVLWEGGGAKFADTSNLTVRNNYSHDNYGYGLWTDIDAMNTLYEHNLLINNAFGGINHEISYDAVIRDNVLIGNGDHPSLDWLWGAAIQIQNSKNVEIYDNYINMSSGGNGIALIQQNRGSGKYGDHLVKNNSIHHNTIVSNNSGGITGGVADYNEASLLSPISKNIFDYNKYYMPDGDHWWWGDFPSGDNWAAYQKDTNQDDHSSLFSPALDPGSWADLMPPGFL